MTNLRGAANLTAAMLCFAVSDSFVKVITPALGPGAVITLMSLTAMAVFWPMALRAGEPVISRDWLHRAVVIRNLGEMGATGMVVISLTLVPLSTFTAILQLHPLAVTVGAYLILREDVGWRRWAAVGVGLLGALLILRPGTSEFSGAALLVFGAIIGMTMRDIGARMAPVRFSSQRLGVWAMASTLPLGLAMMAVNPPAGAVTPAIAVFCLCLMVSGTLGYWFATAAMRSGEVSAIVPFRYTRLIFGLALGATVFAERPDGFTLLGAGVILAAGLYALAREARVKRALQQSGSPR